MYTSPYIGKTGIVDAVIRAKFPLLQSGTLEPLFRSFLFTGPPGVAKTMLAADLANALAGHRLNVDFRMGSEVNVELVRDWCRSAPHRSMFGGLTVRIIDEVNTVTSTAITELRKHLLYLPPWEVIFATTNLPPNQLQEPLQTRFKVYHFDRVPASQVTGYLVQQFPDVPPNLLAEIARKTAGDVRAAKADADSQLDVIRYQQQQVA
jgi:replication-associated recombination protein RarA